MIAQGVNILKGVEKDAIKSILARKRNQFTIRIFVKGEQNDKL